VDLGYPREWRRSSRELILKKMEAPGDYGTEGGGNWCGGARLEAKRTYSGTPRRRRSGNGDPLFAGVNDESRPRRQRPASMPISRASCTGDLTAQKTDAQQRNAAVIVFCTISRIRRDR